jgi:HEAT repeat protein
VRKSAANTSSRTSALPCSRLGAQAAFADHLLAALREPEMDPGVRQAAVWFLRMVEDRRAVRALLRVAQERGADPGLRGEAVQALGLLKVERAAGPLVGLLLDAREHEWVRRLAAQALGRLDDPHGRDVLFRVVKDPEQPPGVRGDAAEALTSFQDARAVPTLLAQLGDPSPEVRFWAVFALGCSVARRWCPNWSASPRPTTALPRAGGRCAEKRWTPSAASRRGRTRRDRTGPILRRTTAPAARIGRLF